MVKKCTSDILTRYSYWPQIVIVIIVAICLTGIAAIYIRDRTSLSSKLHKKLNCVYTDESCDGFNLNEFIINGFAPLMVSAALIIVLIIAIIRNESITIYDFNNKVSGEFVGNSHIYELVILIFIVIALTTFMYCAFGYYEKGPELCDEKSFDKVINPTSKSDCENLVKTFRGQAKLFNESKGEITPEDKEASVNCESLVVKSGGNKCLFDRAVISEATVNKTMKDVDLGIFYIFIAIGIAACSTYIGIKIKEYGEGKFRNLKIKYIDCS